jgi:hypothetical protein
MTCATKGNRFLDATGLSLRFLNAHLPTPPRRRSFPPDVLEILAEISKILTPLLILTSPHSRVHETRLLVVLRLGEEGRITVV